MAGNITPKRSSKIRGEEFKRIATHRPLSILGVLISKVNFKTCAGTGDWNSVPLSFPNYISPYATDGAGDQIAISVENIGVISIWQSPKPSLAINCEV